MTKEIYSTAPNPEGGFDVLIERAGTFKKVGTPYPTRHEAEVEATALTAANDANRKRVTPKKR